MQIDFHFCVIKLLAEKAGFSPADAHIISTASQLIDDATAHRPFRLPSYVKCDFVRVKGRYFDPICTAHKGFQTFGDFSKLAQQKVYMAFHFLPPQYFDFQADYSYVTEPDSKLANEIIHIAKRNFIDNPENRTYNLIALGIALHTYADTFAHQGFSGRHNAENNVDNIRILTNNHWRKIGKLKALRNKIMPEIGHAEGLHYPDYPYLVWRYKKNQYQTVVRNNTDIYTEAAKKIFDILCQVSQTKHKLFSEFSYKLIKIFRTPSQSALFRFFLYPLYFPEITFLYTPKQWILELFNPIHNIHFLSKKDDEFKWLLFQKAAYYQREFVIKSIKPL